MDKDHDILIDIIYSIIRFVGGPIVKLIWVKEVSGLKNIPKKGAVIVAFNHQSYFDFICFIAVSPRNIHYLSAEKFFAHPIWKIIMKIMGQIPVDRKSRDKRNMHNVVYEHLDKGKMIGIFPEGTRSPDRENMLKAFSGVARFSYKKHIPVIPVGIQGAYEVMSRHDKFPRLKKNIKIIVGRPIYFEEYRNFKLNRRAFTVLTNTIMAEISKLSGKSYVHTKA